MTYWDAIRQACVLRDMFDKDVYVVSSTYEAFGERTFAPFMSVNNIRHYMSWNDSAIVHTVIMAK